MKFRCSRCGCNQFIVTHKIFDVMQTDELFEFNAIIWRSISMPDEYSLRCADSDCQMYWSEQPTLDEVRDECIRLGVLK